MEERKEKGTWIRGPSCEDRLSDRNWALCVNAWYTCAGFRSTCRGTGMSVGVPTRAETGTGTAHAAK